MGFYESLFEGAEIASVDRYGGDAGAAEGMVKRATLRLPGQTLIRVHSPVELACGFPPAISLFVSCPSEDEVDHLFAALAEGGTVLMGLDAYPFSKRFGWVDDRFGVSWQLSLADGEAFPPSCFWRLLARRTWSHTSSGVSTVTSSSLSAGPIMPSSSRGSSIQSSRGFPGGGSAGAVGEA